MCALYIFITILQIKIVKLGQTAIMFIETVKIKLLYIIFNMLLSHSNIFILNKSSSYMNNPYNKIEFNAVQKHKHRIMLIRISLRT